MMLVFPQLSSGAMTQHPVRFSRSTRAVRNNLIDGSDLKWPASEPGVNRWDFTLRDLTAAESASIQELFTTAQGRLGSFTFLDPAANLLAYSQALDKPCWVKDPMIQITPGILDPFGGESAVRLVNSGQAAQAISQTIAAPAWFRYAFSAYARSSSGSTLSLQRSAQADSQARTAVLAAKWTRRTVAGSLSSNAESVTFSVVLPAGASVEIFGLQAEPQPSSSAYKASGARNGVYSHARFDDDVLRMVSDGPDRSRFDLRIVARD